MEIRMIEAKDAALDRIYIATAVLENFRGHKHVEAHLFRSGADKGELEALRGKNLVAPPDPRMPAELLAGATEDAALGCILEAFTRQEADDLCAYLQKRYADQIESLVICPMELPVPLGVGPLADIPQSGKSGFIRFDRAGDYPLGFGLSGYYDLGEQPGR